MSWRIARSGRVRITRSADAGEEEKMDDDWAADADRERAANALQAAYADGRLTKDQFDRRISQALQARTYGQLSSVLTGLSRDRRDILGAADNDPVASARERLHGSPRAMDAVEHGRARRRLPRAEHSRGPVKSDPGRMDVFRGSTVDEYVEWLKAWLAAGHRPTHYFPYPFTTWTWLTAQQDFTTGGECGALAVHIIVPPGIRHTGGDLGHNCLYFLDGPRVKGHTMPVFSDPVFKTLGINDFIAEQQARDRATRQAMEARLERSELAAGRSDIGRHLGRGLGPVDYARERLHGNPGAMALLDEVERGRARRRSSAAGRSGSPAGQPDPAPLPAGRERPETPRTACTWCIACQAMVPYADWPSHVTHSRAALNRPQRHRRESAMQSGGEALHAYEVTPDDAALIRMMAGANFGPDAKITLPSGKTITGAEMQRWIENNEDRDD